MGIFDLNFNPFKSTDKENDFFAGLWTDRTKNAYKDFFSKGGWEKPKNWLNPGGVVANPAQQIADPGNFFTAEEHENWVSGKGVSDRTLASAMVAGIIYGGIGAPGMSNLFSGLGSGGEGVAGEAGADPFSIDLFASEPGFEGYASGGSWLDKLGNIGQQLGNGQSSSGNSGTTTPVSYGSGDSPYPTTAELLRNKSKGIKRTKSALNDYTLFNPFK